MYQESLDAVVKNIREIRERGFISQDYMAAKMGIAQNTYSKIELGKTKITLERLLMIAHILEVDAKDLLNIGVMSQQQ